MEPLIPPEEEPPFERKSPENPSFERKSSEDPTFERRPSMSSEEDSSSASASAFRPSQSTSQLPNHPSSSGDNSCVPHRATQSTSRLPFLPLNNDGSSSAGSGSNDSDSSEGGGKRRKNFEAFVMTGDRMINLAKTPANADWKSKYQKPSTITSTTSARGLESTFEAADKPVATLATPEEKPVSPELKSRLARRSIVRSSKSEDQLSGYEELYAADGD